MQELQALTLTRSRPDMKPASTSYQLHESEQIVLLLCVLVPHNPCL